MDQILAKINNLKSWQAAIIITFVGFAVFFMGLTNPFMHDDIGQIVNNPVVHSIANIRLFFEGSTFYNDNGIAPLGGYYYRPLMTTVFSILYSVFGLHTLAFHLFQLLLYIGVAVLLYLILRYSFKPVLALLLSLVFLVHPINSQIVYAIPSMQEPLFLFFGLLALWLLFRFSSARSLFAVAICLFLSLLSKETGVLFEIIALLYLFWFDRKRLAPLAGIAAPLVVLWLVLKVHAVGLASKPLNKPIDHLSLAGRLLTLPATLLFYLTKLMFPLKLATGYYWVYPTFSIRNVLLPLLIDAAVLGLLIYLAFLIRKWASEAMFYTYLFFGAWLLFGLLPYLQILPLDETVSETWFCFSFIGLLGMAGVVLVVFKPKHIQPSWLLVIAVLVIGVLGLRSSLRGFDWRNEYTLAQHDLAASKEDYDADSRIAKHLYEAGDFSQAKVYAETGLNGIPEPESYNNLGSILIELGDYPGALEAYGNSLRYGNNSAVLYENIARLSVIYGPPNSYQPVYMAALTKYPQDTLIWTMLAVLEQKNGNNKVAQAAISHAAASGQVNRDIYYGIMNNRPFTTSVLQKKVYVP